MRLNPRKSNKNKGQPAAAGKVRRLVVAPNEPRRRRVVLKRSLRCWIPDSVSVGVRSLGIMAESCEGCCFVDLYVATNADFLSHGQFGLGPPLFSRTAGPNF